MKNFINLKDIPAEDLRKILNDAKKRKNKRKKISTLDADKDKPLKGKLLIQMYEKPSSRTRLSFHLSIIFYSFSIHSCASVDIYGLTCYTSSFIRR